MPENLETQFVKNVRTKIVASGLVVARFVPEITDKLPIALRGRFFTSSSDIESTKLSELNKLLNTAEKQVKGIMGAETFGKGLFYLPSQEFQRPQRPYAEFSVSHEVGSIAEGISQQIQVTDIEDSDLWKSILERRLKTPNRLSIREVITVCLYADNLSAFMASKTTPSIRSSVGSLSASKFF